MQKLTKISVFVLEISLALFTAPSVAALPPAMGTAPRPSIIRQLHCARLLEGGEQSVRAKIASEPEVQAAIHGKTAPLIGAEDIGSLLRAETVHKLIQKYQLLDNIELMTMLIEAAKVIARPEISNYNVSAVGLEKETGNLLFGGNVEFLNPDSEIPALPLNETIHGEQFVMARAFQRGTTISAMALQEANPCGHCRQFISEFRGARNIVLADPLGHDFTLADIHLWPFDPPELGEEGVEPGLFGAKILALPTPFPTSRLQKVAWEAAKYSYAPYSKSPAGIALLMNDGRVFSGSYIENVAFNPSLGPLHSALINMIANGYAYSDIVQVELVQGRENRADYRRQVQNMLETIAPKAKLAVTLVQPR
jgi:cytidine deaminase